MKKLALTVPQRLVLQELLPGKGNFLNMKRIRKLREALSFTDEEMAKFALVTDQSTGFVQWDTTKDEAVEIEFGPELFVAVKNKLVELSDKDDLEAKHLDLYEKFAADDAELRLVE